MRHRKREANHVWSVEEILELLAGAIVRFTTKSRQELDRGPRQLSNANPDRRAGAEAYDSRINCGAVMRGERPSLPAQVRPCGFKTPPGLFESHDRTNVLLGWIRFNHAGGYTDAGTAPNQLL